VTSWRLDFSLRIRNSTQFAVPRVKADEVTLNKLGAMSEVELLQAHGAVIDELIRRDVVRTRNNPIGDYTEWLVCQRLKLTRENNSKASCDAFCDNGIRYQIKGRQSEARTIQLSAIRNLYDHGFNFVIAVIFNNDYSIRFAVKLTHDAVVEFSKHREHVNGHILILTDKVIDRDGVENITDVLRGT